MKKHFIIIISLLLSLLFSTHIFATELGDEGDEEEENVPLQTTEHPEDLTIPPDLVSEAAIVIDANTGSILYEKNAYTPEYPASITKVVTCLLALEHNVGLNETVTMSYDAVWGIERDSTHIALDVGEEISAEECLYAMMVTSANEASWAMAEHVTGGSLEDFVAMMNAKAEELGCKNTHFANANGLHDDNHYTCAYDMSLFMREALQYDMFRTLTSTITYTVSPTNLTEEERYLYNTLKMIRPYSKYYYEYVEGGKTGYTSTSNNTLATYAKKGDLELICVIMNCSGRVNAYSDTRALYEYCFNNYSYIHPLRDFSFNTSNIEDENNLILSNFYNTGNSDALNLSVDNQFALLVKNDVDTAAITKQTVIYDKPTENSIGEIQFYYGDTLLGQTPITYKNGDTTAGSDTILNQALQNTAENTTKEKSSLPLGVRIILIILAVLVILFVLYVLFIHFERYRYRRKRDRARRNQLHF